MEPVQIRGRGAADNPRNRFERLAYEPDPEERDPDDPGPRTQFFRDSSRSIVATNDSPDVGFTHSVNPYRGCEHGCVYCFARPTHEWLGMSAGLDFESRILVKEDAPELLRAELTKRSWAPVPLAFSGVTDCYQPIERKLEVTRRCVQLLAEFRNPVGIITKNHLVTRETELLAEMAEWNGAVVHLSVTTLDAELQRKLEPRASSPARRLAAVETLAKAGVPVGVLIAPLIPGLTDHELPAILRAVADAGARWAGFVPLRLPLGVADLFDQWLERHYPDRRGQVMHRVREVRGGRLNDPRFVSRMRGEGEYADQLRALFRVTARRAGLNRDPRPELSVSHFRRPDPAGQLGLFG